MRLRGSILIVVLGLLAVLAVVGIAFVTMSSIESNTASNFALQAQFDLAADGAVDYVCQALIRDVWEFGTDSASAEVTAGNYRAYTGWYLTGKYGTWPWDFPVTTITPDPKPTQDLFLATSWSNVGSAPVPSAANAVYSFRAATPTIKPYFLNTWNLDSTSKAYVGTGIPGSGTDGSPNNLGIPGGTTPATAVAWYAPANGLWIPELAFPYEHGVIRVSVTVQDHAAMLNLNAHGTPTAASATPWAPYGKAAGKGYFVCDVTPAGVSWLSGFTDINKLLDGTKTPPGRWGKTGTEAGPGNKRLGEIFIQNPTIIATSTSGSKDRPFTLDDEFELRRLTGTYATSRLEQIIGSSALDSTPDTTTPAKVTSRLSLTTVGWNAEVIPAAAQNACTPKCDINLTGDTGLSFVNVLGTGGVFDTSTTAPAGNLDIASQFAANVRAFKDRYVKTTGNYFKSYSGKYGARRQIFLSKVQAKVERGQPDATQDRWTVRIQVYNPWYGNYAGDLTSGFDVTEHQIKVCFTDGSSKPFTFPTTNLVPNRSTWEEPDATKRTFTQPTGKTLDKITLEATGPGIIDQIMGADLGAIGATATTKYRPFGVYDEPRGSDDTDPKCVVTVLYVKKWADGDATTWGLTPQGPAVEKGKGIPIRFPHSVPMDDAAGKAVWDTKVNGPLPPYYTSNDATAKQGVFKAFLRVGDLNQVLCPATKEEATGNAFWPWVTRVAANSGNDATTPPTPLQEQAVKWDWWKTGGLPAELNTPYDVGGTVPLYNSTPSPPVRQYRRYNGANVFCVDSPWADSYDNDGDGKADNLDTAADKATGRFCGQEVRVAGRINLNTATDQALKALGMGFTGLTNESTYTPIATTSTNRPLRSPAEILGISSITATFPADFLGGPLEKRDYPYTLISNIATVRSDTFSIYGTVQFLIPPGREETAATTSLAKIKIVRTRRFWALVDRSPVFNAKPGSASFIRPRVMNFQWLD